MTTPGTATPSHVGQVTEEWAKIPPQRRREKRLMSLVGLLLIELAYAGAREWDWPWGYWFACGGFGFHALAGDHRRLLFSWFVAALKDAARLAREIGSAAREIRKGIDGVRGKNGNGEPPADPTV